ncbi:MAG TPA: SDR family NAD(P)-dependent oxidoreductase [Kribbellaceae bacterium]|nr:SDR family NAD(P)-dependent oxidoreductase [Kribbellaceae bacterium]
MSRTLVWISGASSGIGAALAAAVPYDDAVVVDVSRRGGTPGTEHLAADLADPASWPVVARDFARRLDGFTGDRVVFVHNAGTLTPIGPAGTVDQTAYARNVLLNSATPQVLGDAFLRAVAGLACEQHLVMLSSGSARTAYEGWSSYCAGKAAVEQWVRVAGLEQRRRTPGCRVVAVAPGVVDTGMQDQIRALDAADFPQVARFRDLHDAGALTDPRDAARRIWSVLDRDLENGACVDVRTLD